MEQQQQQHELYINAGKRSLHIVALASDTLILHLRTPTKHVGIRLDGLQEDHLREYLNERHRAARA